MSNTLSRGLLWAVISLCTTGAVEGQQTVRLPARDAALKDRPTDVYTVGTVDGRDWEMFSGVRSVAFDRADNMYLLDGQNLRIVVFDARGQYVRQFGKKGGGPGEFQAPIGMDILSDGNVAVSDLGNRAFILFKPTGEYIRNVPFGDDAGFPIGIAADANGGLVVRAMPRFGGPTQASGDELRFSNIVRHSLSGPDAETRTLFRVPVTPPKITDSGSTSGARRISAVMMDPVFGPRPSFAVLPTGLAVHHESAYDIRIVDANGTVTRTLTRAISPRKVTKKDQEAWQERSRTEQASGGGPTVVVGMSGSSAGNAQSVQVGRAGSGQAMQFSMDNVVFAEYMSVVSSVRSDPQGRIWVQRRKDDGAAAGSIDLVMPDGRYIGTLPPQALPNAVSASGLAAWVVTDDLGVERVTVRRLPASWR